MELGAVLGFVKDYADLAIGLALVLAAAAVLPGRMRAYVLTAGLAVIAVEGYLRVRNRRALAEADKQRDELRVRAGQLDKRREGLEKEVADLNRQLAEGRAQQAALLQGAASLQQRGDALSEQKQRLDAESESQIRKNDALLGSIGSQENLLEILREARHAREDLEAAKTGGGNH